MNTHSSQSPVVREARQQDFEFVLDLMEKALNPYYGGDHRAHAKRIFETHIGGGTDHTGHFSFEQRMFIVVVDGTPAGMINIVGKRQGNYKISPLIVSPQFMGTKGLGSVLLQYAESYAKSQHSRQLYCTVAETNRSAMSFFLKKGFTCAGKSDNHYKIGVREVMLYKFIGKNPIKSETNLSIIAFEDRYKEQATQLILSTLPSYFDGIDTTWVHALYSGYDRRNSEDINTKYKLIWVAIDENNRVHGIIGATPKKGNPIKLMPFVTYTPAAFTTLLDSAPHLLKPYGHKLYTHIVPTIEETIALQTSGWTLDAAMPSAYRADTITQQWGITIGGIK